MTTEAIPKLAFIDEWTEELLDQRLGQYHTLEGDSKNATKFAYSRFVSEVPTPPVYQRTFHNNTSIHNASTFAFM